MAGSKLDRRVRNTKTLLRGALIEIMQEKPVGRIHVNEVCEKAGINRGTFYAHYADVQQLQEQVFDEFLGKIGEIMDSSNPIPGSQDAIARMTRILRYVYDNRQLALTLLGENSSIASIDAVLRLMWEKKIIRTPVSVPEEQMMYLYRFVAAGSLSVVCEWIAHGTEPPEAVATMITSTLFTELRNLFG